jgi:hypothetical protein
MKTLTVVATDISCIDAVLNTIDVIVKHLLVNYLIMRAIQHFATK